MFVLQPSSKHKYRWGRPKVNSQQGAPCLEQSHLGKPERVNLQSYERECFKQLRSGVVPQEKKRRRADNLLRIHSGTCVSPPDLPLHGRSAGVSGTQIFNDRTCIVSSKNCDLGENTEGNSHSSVVSTSKPSNVTMMGHIWKVYLDGFIQILLK